jgi:hypothetical protein
MRASKPVRKTAHLGWKLAAAATHHQIVDHDEHAATLFAAFFLGVHEA